MVVPTLGQTDTEVESESYEDLPEDDLDIPEWAGIFHTHPAEPEEGSIEWLRGIWEVDEDEV